MEQDSLLAPLTLLAQQCLRISAELNQLYLDQMAMIGHLTAQNLLKIQQGQYRIELLDGLFYIQFYTAYALDSGTAPVLVESHFYFQQYKAEALEEFFLQDIYFLTGDLKPQHSLYLRDKAKQLRKLILNQVYEAVNGPARVLAFLQQMSVVQAEIIDHHLIEAGLYTTPVMQNVVLDLQDIYFLTGDLKPQHSLYLRDKAKQLRKLILNQVYEAVNGPARVLAFLQQMSVVQAEIIDHHLIEAGLYTTPVMQNVVLDEQD